jgi:hypothetical protein
MKKESIIVAVCLLALLVVFRTVAHPDNLSPLWAICLFSGSYWRGSQFRFVIPIAGMFATDLYLGLYPGAQFNYLAVLLCVMVAPKLLASVWRVLLSGGLAAVLFFVVSNAGVWWSSGMYPHTSAGLMDCFNMGLPFFRATLEGTLIFSALLYGSYRLVFAPVRMEGFFKLNYGRSQR